MEETRYICETQKGLTETDMVAAQNLVQLSGSQNEDSSDMMEEREQSLNDITSALMEEIFGKESEICRPKKRRFRSIACIYRSTKPLDDAIHVKKMRC